MDYSTALTKINNIKLQAQKQYKRHPDEISCLSKSSHGEVASSVTKLMNDLVNITEKTVGLDIVDDGFAISGVIRSDMALSVLQENISEAKEAKNDKAVKKFQQLQKDIKVKKPSYMFAYHYSHPNALYHIKYAKFNSVIRTANALESQLTW